MSRKPGKILMPEGYLDRIQEMFWMKDATVTEIIKSTGISRTAIFTYKQGDTVPNLLAAAKLCKFFGCSLDWLVFGK